MLWGASHASNAKIIQVDLNTGVEKEIASFEAWSFDLDTAMVEAVSWGWGPGLQRGLYRIKEGQAPVCMFMSEQPHRNINVLPSGEMICRAYFKEPGHSAHERILRIAADGEVLYYSDAGVPHHTLYAIQALCVDPVRKEVWALNGTVDYRMNIICFDFELKRKFTLAPRSLSMTVFHSIALHPSHGGVWVFGSTSPGKSSLGLLVSNEKVKHRPYLFQQIVSTGEHGGIVATGRRSGENNSQIN